jgi:hypothetical protein
MVSFSPASLLMRTVVMIIDHAFDRLGEISFGLAQGLRAGDFGAPLQ